ncbi:uncharacterized protein [Haliotis asinina]|uniref:uncharacterized protein n=1 Tax=Haliotis asinina TaxID=109174 RepID=UPI003531F96C
MPSTTTNSDELEAEDLEEDPVPYQLEPASKLVTKKFRTDSHCYKLRFNPAWLQRQQPEDLPIVLRDQFDAVLQDLRNEVNGHDGDRVGLTLEHPALDTPIRITFRRMENLQGEHIMAKVENVQQSNRDLNIDDTMDSFLLHVDDPDRIGEGHGRLKHIAGLNVFLEKKQCIVQIENENDPLCFARALVVAMHHVHQPDPVTKEWTRQWKYLCNHRRPAQLEVAKALFRQLGIPGGPCTGHATWDLFSQRLAPDYQLKIYSQDVMNRLLYKSEVPQPTKILHLYHHHHHYDVITSMAAFTGYSYYCDTCDQGYDHPQDHRCTREFCCHWCLHAGYCGDVVNEGLSCLQCGRWFRNPTCFQRRQAASPKHPSTCSTIHTCHRCYAKVNVRHIQGMVNHKCGTNRNCKICKEPLKPNHQCYMTPIEPPKCNDDGEKRNEDKERQQRQFIFYDFECTQDQGTHVPNLCVVHLGCGKCISEASSELCEKCPWRKEGEGPSRMKVFRGATTWKDMGDWLLSLAEKKTVKKRKAPSSNRPPSKRAKPSSPVDVEQEEDDDEQQEENVAIDDDEVLVMAHNYRGYDGHLLQQYFHRHLVKAPQVTLRGNHILQMTVGRLVFKDSLNFLTMALKQFPKTFGLTELKKGYFPHFFNTDYNQGYVGPYPPVSTYDPDSMFPAERQAFLTWYYARVAEGSVFDLDEELLAYCQSDVDILRRGCAAFRHIFIQQNDVDPFYEAVTLPMACMLTFRKLFLEPRTIAIIPPQGYRPQRRYSLQCLHWLNWIMHQHPGLHIQHARNGGEARFDGGDGSRYTVDGYDANTRTVYEYLGCFWHGCTRCYKTDRCEPHATLGTAPWERFHHTMYRLGVLRQHPDIDQVVTQWECDFLKEQKDNEDLRAFLTTLQGPHAYLPDPLDPREAFFGGRTNATKLYYEAKEEEEIKYMSTLTSASMARTPWDIPRSRIILPCQTCLTFMDSFSVGSCHPRTSTIHCFLTASMASCCFLCVALVLKKSLLAPVPTVTKTEHGLTTYDPDTQEGGLFAKYVNNFFQIKQEASGYPEGCTDPEEYIREIQQKEGVTLDRAHIRKNPGLRALAKACLNNHWGKFGQRIGFDRTEYISSPQRYFALLRDERCQVKDVNIINEDLLCVTYEPRPEFHDPHPAHNVVIAAWVTAQARLKLYSYLKPLDRHILYFDTDSIIYIHRPLQYNPPLGDTLGELTDELGGGNSIQIFASAGPKNYTYKLRHPQPDGSVVAVSKVRGFTLNHRASHYVHFDSMKNLICKRDRVSITVPYPRRIIRTGLRQNNTLLSKDTSKVYRMVYTKRRVIYDSEGMPVETLPYGYKGE